MRRVRLLGNRPLGMVLGNLAAPANYRAMAAMARRYPRPVDAAGRYLLGRGRYPVEIAVRTPLGVARPTLWSHHDMFTLNEVFCRADYASGPSDCRVVDVGSNIGISALYFLTRAADVECMLYEPDERNRARLEGNLRGFEDRYTLAPVAVADFDGDADFGVEPSGRYGGLGVKTGETTRVPCLRIDAVLQAALARWAAIDVLKLDVEGMEGRLLAAAAPELLSRVRTIYVEGRRRDLPLPAGFDARERCETVRLANREGPGLHAAAQC
jgi:FkbM family methyltransferase